VWSGIIGGIIGDSYLSLHSHRLVLGRHCRYHALPVQEVGQLSPISAGVLAGDG